MARSGRFDERGGSSMAQRNYRFRSVVIILAGILGFILGALYLSVEQMEVTHVVVATGSGAVTPGEPAAIRLAALERRGRGSYAVQVQGARWREGGGPEQPLTIDTEGSRPAIVRFRVPGDADGAAAVLLDLRVLGAADGDRERTLTVPLEVLPPIDVAVASPAAPEEVAADALRVSLLPEVRVLSWRFDGALFARVTDAAGAPVAAPVTLRIGKDDSRSAHTDRFGLASFPLSADRPRYQLHARATVGERRGEVEEDLRPVPRGRRLRLLPHVVAPGGRYRLEVATLEPEETLHCDVVGDGRIRDAFTLTVKRGNASTERLAPARPGRYAIQCAPYYRTPGPGFTTAALLVSRDGEPLGALLDAVEPTDSVDARWLASVRAAAANADEPARERLRAYLLARLTPDYAASAHLVSTRESDRAALAAERSAVRGKLLAALGVALTALLVWALVVVGANLREARRQSAAMAALLAEPDDGEQQAGADAAPGGSSSAFAAEDIPEPPPPTETSFVRARSAVQYAVIAVLLIVDLVALLWLLGNVIR